MTNSVGPDQTAPPPRSSLIWVYTAQTYLPQHLDFTVFTTRTRLMVKGNITNTHSIFCLPVSNVFSYFLQNRFNVFDCTGGICSEPET